MEFDGWSREIGKIDTVMIQEIAGLCNSAGWTGAEYDRNERPLRSGRLVVFPFPIKPRDYAPSAEQRSLLSACRPVCDAVQAMMPDHLFVRGELVMLPPGVTLGWHRDAMWFHEHCRRIHVPVVTNAMCHQLWDGQAVHLEVGTVYEINNRRRHSASNAGSTNRIHVILDLCARDLWHDFIASGGNPNRMTCDPELDPLPI